MNLINNKFNLLKMDTLLLTDVVIQKRLSEQNPHTLNYKNRILKLIETCRNHQIEPVFITQPSLYGSGTDSLLRVNLETIKIDNKNNGKAGWLILQLYNDQLRSAGKETNTYVIDLANEMPKNSIYFYDFVHFTNQGCIKVAEIVSKDLSPYLKNQYKQFYLENKF